MKTLRVVVAALIFMVPGMMNAAVSALTKSSSRTGSLPSKQQADAYTACSEDVTMALESVGAIKNGDSCQVATSSSGETQIMIGKSGTPISEPSVDFQPVAGSHGGT